MSAAEKSAKQALVKYKCTLGGGTEWYTAGPKQYDIFIKTFKEAVADKPVEKVELLVLVI